MKFVFVLPTDTSTKIWEDVLVNRSGVSDVLMSYWYIQKRERERE